MNDILLNGIVAACSSVLAWFLARRKYNAEVDNSVISGLKEALEIYKQISDDNKDRIKENQVKLKEVLDENLQLKSELTILKAQVELMLRYNCMRANCPKRITNSDDVIKKTIDDKEYV